MNGVLRVAVVGHTNTGKTSLLRTLARDVGFGEVSDSAGTTRHVEGLRLMAGGRPVVELFDTPGMEDAIALLEFVDALAAPGERLDGPERLARFLGRPEAPARFEQEAKVLRQMLASDAALYVVDARDPVLPKHRDELELLAGCARPLLPVLNFVASSEARVADWRAALARLNLHAVVSFDTVAPALDGERELFDSLATLMHAHRPALQRLIDARAQEADERRAAARRLVAELLVELAARRDRLAVESGAAAAPERVLQEAVERLRDAVRQREQDCVEALLRLYRFRPDDARASALPLTDGRWDDDLFNPETLRQMGLRLSTGVAAGAAAGVGIDLMAGGLTLGAAAALGAIAGGLWQTFGHYGERIAARLRGHRELTVDDLVLRVVALRQYRLLAALEGRGHAALAPIEVQAAEADADEVVERWREGGLPHALEKARAHPEWVDGQGDEERDAAIAAIAAALD
ncbi:GTPase/DUF3482 domain-containing protein [Thauera linaloolentis]|uniref:GTP-binding HSR1-like protein n=1 Tax=Thauera linaloolentis (strain DSM 12138 / JCM 21573 / CCUG 41526 / CIP 105981 / IAM 15112 / NBRC 102519 / 47Lol) TaxID=1123367 RepID=N6Y796_THAL4|nr:GTPase/DUF3482 domain-containing protein [Thauera linaloolentis]ENO87430.1 GTP-binding HSR1-like protein [Thauera linaloolentis 47Lol = DSM 12138]MCM8565080.1 GTPase/DUF3482 domain-containing protein [Thauera linaloolentis]